MNVQEVASELIRETTDRYLSELNSESEIVDFQIGPVGIRVHVSSKGLHEFIYPAFAWNARPSNVEPDVEIFALDGDDSIVSPWGLGDFLDGNKVRGLESGDVLAAFDLQHGVLNMFDRTTKRGLFWTAQSERLPEWEFGAPLRIILTWALIDHGLQVIHSAGIGKHANLHHG